VPGLAVTAAALAACGAAGAATSSNATPGAVSSNTTASPSTSSAPASGGTALALRTTSLGRVLTDGKGFTLYAFEADKGMTSACSGACATAWPPAAVSGSAPHAGAGLKQSLVGQITRADGSRQLTFAGHPLYRFVMDTSAGSTKGQGLIAFGARWDVLTATGHEVTPAPAPAHKAPAAPKPAPAPRHTTPTNGIPQNGGGDGDADNSGGPSDGDGNV
jgi:predicted lipoprotein with Yx(FWY)xxD motif